MIRRFFLRHRVTDPEESEAALWVVLLMRFA
jgi:hypothetical protein